MHICFYSFLTRCNWISAQTKDYEKVAALYSTQELSFLPTVSPNFIRDNNSAKEYFKDFLKKLPFGTVTSEQTQSFGTDAYLVSSRKASFLTRCFSLCTCLFITLLPPSQSFYNLATTITVFL